MRDTIFAPATAAGRAAVAVVRISGPSASAVAKGLCGRLPKPRYAGLRSLNWDGLVLDHGLVLWMPGPHSFTGEDCAEIHLHGGVAVVEAVCSALTQAGARLADPGEFTRRAFEAGRLDLTQAEAVADLVDAQTEAQRRQALGQLSGGLSARYHRWCETLIDALAFLEAGIDFPEDDVPDGVVASALPLIEAVDAEIADELAGARGEWVRAGLKVALVGAPNVGKSSVLNALISRDAAIVTPIPGTTRDIVEVQVTIGGQVVRLADTAGLRESSDPIEREGIRRARQWIEEAEIRIAIGDASRPTTFETARALLRDNDLLVANKSDMADSSGGQSGAIRISATSGTVTALSAALEREVIERTTGHEMPAITRHRHRALLSECQTCLQRARRSGQGAELVGEDIRLGLRALERIAGRSDPDAVLDRVFSAFCIGK